MTDTGMSTEWKPCRKCGATTRHDDGLCYRDTRHPLTDPRIGWRHSPETMDYSGPPPASRMKWGAR